MFFGWSAGSYQFATLEDFEAKQPFAFIQGFGFNGLHYKDAALNKERSRQTGYGFYAQDKWQVTKNFTLTYGLRYDGTTNPKARSRIEGQQVYSGVEPDITIGPPPQGPPSDWKQFGPRVGAAYSFDIGNKAAVVRANWGYYYAETPPIFFTAPGANPGKRTSIAPLVPRSSGAFPLQVYLREKSLAALENDCGTAPTTWS